VEQQVATFQFTSTAGTEGFNLNSLKLTQVGTAGSNDITNVKIKYGATVLEQWPHDKFGGNIYWQSIINIQWEQQEISMFTLTQLLY